MGESIKSRGSLPNSIRSTFTIFRRAFRILSPGDKRKSLFVVGIYAFLGMFDIVAVFVLGLVGSLSVSGVASNKPGDRVATILSFLGLADNTLQTQVAVLGIIGAGILTFKSIASLYLSKKTLFFLGRRSAYVSKALLVRLLGQNILKVRSRTIQETIFALTGGVQSVTIGVLGSILLLAADVFLILAFSISLFVVDTLVALSSLLLFSTLGSLLYIYMHKRAEFLGESATALTIKSNDKISEVVSCYRELLVKNRRGFYAREIGDMRLAIAEASANLGVMNLVSKYIMEISMVVGCLAIGAVQFITQPATRAVAVISIFLISSTRIAPAILRVQTSLVTIRSNIGVAKPTLDLIEEYVSDNFLPEVEIKPYEGREAFTHQAFSPSVLASGICFSYPENDREALKNLDLEIHPGEFVGIVGPSGAGKTTLVDLLLGVIQPNEGEITVSGVNPTEAMEIWPGAIAYVPQETNIINGTIKENVCLGFNSSEVPDSDVESLLRDVDLSDLIFNNNGLNSLTGERGSRLSGGQRQRVGLARALFTRPKLLVLDEATSALDSSTEKRLTDYLITLKGTLTMVVIAHRLSTVRNADRIVYISDGRVKGIGSFENLRRDLPEFDSQARAMGL